MARQQTLLLQRDTCYLEEKKSSRVTYGSGSVTILHIWHQLEEEPVVPQPWTALDNPFLPQTPTDPPRAAPCRDHPSRMHPLLPGFLSCPPCCC